MNNPQISVVLPVYNEEKYIRECIGSILNQTYNNFELIIVDDASTDRSMEIINTFNDPRIKLFCNKKNLGIAISLNKGCLNARGEFIARIDANDIATEDRFEEQLKYFEGKANCAVVFSPVLIIDKNGNSTGEISGDYIPPDMIQTWLFYKNCFYHTTALIRKSALSDIPYDETSFTEDYDLWVDLLRDWELHIIDIVLMRVRDLKGGLRYHSGGQNSNIRVRLKQLEWLHIYPNRLELEIHLKLVKKNIEFDPDLLKEKLQWIDKLYIANKKYSIFKEPFFTNRLIEHWNSFVNYIDYKMNLDLFFYIINSPLRDKTSKSLTRVIVKYFPYTRSSYYLNILRSIKKLIWESKRKYLSAIKRGSSTNKIINMQQRFDEQFKTGFWNYLTNLDELAHYSVIIGYCYNWETKPAILDVGCGDGILLEKLTKIGYSYYEGIDLSKEAIKKINHRVDNKTKLIITDMLDYSSDRLFDSIIFSESICYIGSVEKISLIIKKYSGLLNSNGKIIVSNWNNSPNINIIWKEFDKELILIDTVEVSNRYNSKSTIKVYDAP